MDYDEEYDDYLPKRTDDIYQEIADFEEYELTHCVMFEMIVRNIDVKQILHNLKDIKLTQNQSYEMIKPDIEVLNTSQTIKSKVELSESTLVKYREYKSIYENLIKILKDKYYLHFDQNAVNIPEIENPFKEKDFTGMSLNEIKDEFSDALNSPMMKHLSGGIGKYLHRDEYPHYKSDHNVYKGFVTARGIESRCKTFNISSINTYFRRKIVDNNQTNVILNMSLPEEELVAYVKHIKRTLSSDNSKKLKSAENLLGKETKKANKTANFPKKPTATKIADMFFVYDYVTTRLKEDEDCINLMNDEYSEKRDDIKNNPSYTTNQKKIQLQALREEYDENQTNIKIEDIFKDFDEPIENINFKGSTTSNYYYALKPYIEECRYPEFLTGESIIED